MHNMKSIMVQLKCPDCGQVFDTGKPNCPTCGCPADACTRFDPNSQKTEQVANEKRTTDTGYVNEKTITTYANIIYWLAVIIGILVWLISVIGMANAFGVNGFAISFLLGGIILMLYILLAYVARAFIRTFANISINLHELNMKTQ